MMEHDKVRLLIMDIDDYLLAVVSEAPPGGLVDHLQGEK
jgi:hypothetical protein